ncbi:MAG: hypothetical protein LBS04_04825 [Tannerellaceae bacterium]|jgi:hypothetical protein|nr:hypothetical protein [Tannerellaceae bacterium]
MNKIIKSAVLLSGILLLASCKDDDAQTISMSLETHHLLLKNDTTFSEVRIEGTDWAISGVFMDDSLLWNDTYTTGVDEYGVQLFCLHDTMVVKWVELSKIEGGRKLKVKPQPNTTGAERSLEVIFSPPYSSVNDTYLKITQQP